VVVDVALTGSHEVDADDMAAFEAARPWKDRWPGLLDEPDA